MLTRLDHQNAEVELMSGTTEKEDHIQKISVIVPKNPFVRSTKLREVKHCLAALDVEKLMQWWPGLPHFPHRDPKKVRAIQRSLDWRRVAHIAAYLLQSEIQDTPERLDNYFKEIYEPKQLDPGREWPPKVAAVTGFVPSEYPVFSNVLLHVNGADVKRLATSEEPQPRSEGAAHLEFDERDNRLRFSVIDGQHRINGAYFAIRIKQEKDATARWEIPSDLFLDLDPPDGTPKHQAQIFIDVNFYQKKVDKSLVADLFPTARGGRSPLNDKERAQDIGRRLMLEIGPLVGMIQIPGIKYGVKDVVALATLNAAIEDALESLNKAGIESLDQQTKFIAQYLDAWLEGTGRKQAVKSADGLDPSSVVYQGRVLVSALGLIPVALVELKRKDLHFVSGDAEKHLGKWFTRMLERSGLMKKEQFISKTEFKQQGYLGSGGIGRFRDLLWAAAAGTANVSRLKQDRQSEIAAEYRAKIEKQLDTA